MRTGMTIDQLAAEVTRQKATRRDFLARPAALRMTPDAQLELPKAGRFAVTDLAHDQIAAYADIPDAYYGRILAAQPQLFAQTVNTLLGAKTGERRLVRTLDGNARAFLSDRYRPLDNHDLMENLLPELMNRKDLRFAAADVTERKFYLKVISDELEGEVKRGDTVRMGLIISNSEVGCGALAVSPFSERLICTNGAVHANFGQRRAHVGRQIEGDDTEQFFSDETRVADDKAFFLKVRDTVRGILTGDVLKLLLADMKAAAGEPLDGDPAEAVELLAANHGFSADERTSVLRHLIEGADLSRWGVVNAITRAAADAPDFDRATELESIGGALVSGRLPTEPVKTKARRRLTALVPG